MSGFKNKVVLPHLLLKKCMVCYVHTWFQRVVISYPSNGMVLGYTCSVCGGHD